MDPCGASNRKVNEPSKGRHLHGFPLPRKHLLGHGGSGMARPRSGVGATLDFTFDPHEDLVCGIPYRVLFEGAATGGNRERAC